MYKKMADRTSIYARIGSKNKSRGKNNSQRKKAQITIFIIVGIILLFVFLAIMSLSTKLKQGQLEEAQEKALTSLFKKEALRIYVEDCLMDELEKGLILLGRQGRIWNDQPGGRREFDPGRTGVMLNEKERVFYALTNEIYFEHPNAYPCNNETNSPEFCRYQFPDTQVGFGELQLSPREVERDLQRFLINRTIWCVENFTKGEIAAQAQVTAGDIKLDLDINNDGINVKVNYPLKLSLGGEELFQISKFDFFYPSKFKQLLDAAVTYPLQHEQKYADFNYTEEVLISKSFTYTSEPQYFVEGFCAEEKQGKGENKEQVLTKCKFPLYSDMYASLGINMKSQSLNGDTLFVFEPNPPLQIITTPEKYVYQFVRQNRPPALDYIHRKECPELDPEYRYDYLVVKDDPELGTINISASAIDADEEDNDNIKYSFSSKSFPLEKKLTTQFIIKPEDVNNKFQEGFYDLSVDAVDEHELGDWQDIRILVDRPMSVGVSLETPYSAKYQLDEDTYLVSKEDPVFVYITLPESSKYAKGETVKLEYTDSDESRTTMDFKYELSKDKTFCINLPSSQIPESKPVNTCTVEDYNEIPFENWPNEVFDFPLFRKVTPVNKPGKLKLSFSTNYCVREDSEGSTLGNFEEIEIIVEECIPNDNPEHPYASPYHNYKFGVLMDEKGNPILDEEGNKITDFNDFKGELGKGKLKGEKEINPFLATHSCCSPKFEIYQLEDEKECFVNPLPGCYGQIKGYTTVPDFKGYILEEQFAICDGTRGNACGGKESRLWNNELVCGSKGYEGCTKANINCQGNLSWNYVDSNKDGKNDGWCHGEMGCQSFCTNDNPVVNRKSLNKEDNPLNQVQEIISTNINNPVVWSTEDKSANLNFGCGCISGAQKDGGDDGRLCDNDYDGKFDKVCKEGVCSKQ